MTSSRRGFMRALGWGGAALVGLRPARASAAGNDRKAAIIARAISYERTLGTRSGASLRLGIAFAQGNNTSTRDSQAWLDGFASISDVTVNGNAIEVLTLAWGSGVPERLDVLLVCDGLQSQSSAIAAFTSSKRILSVGSVREYLDGDCTLGVFDVDGKPRITINLTAAEREKVKFSSRLLKLADVVR